MNRASPFQYDPRPLELDAKKDHLVILPRGIQDRTELFAALRTQLQLPPYFGDNLDALSECLRDLSWVNQRRVALVHEELPHFEAAVLATYLDVLAECVTDWTESDEHELLVLFPVSARDAINALAP